MALAFAVVLVQPLAALSLVEACPTCGDHDRDPSACCCAPAEPRQGEQEPGCCAKEHDADAVQASMAHDCSCRHLPEYPDRPVPAASLQDVDAAARAARAIALGQRASACAPAAPMDARRSGTASFGGGGPPPPREAARGSPLLLRRAEDGIQSALALLSVARI